MDEATRKLYEYRRALDVVFAAMQSIWATKGQSDDWIYDEMGSELSHAYFWVRDALEDRR